MNIFYLDDDPAAAARMHCDKHVVKMILETAQLLSTAWHLHPWPEGRIPTPLYKPTHKNHPSALWVRSSIQAYLWTWALGTRLCSEYTFRYDKTHASAVVIEASARVPLLPTAKELRPPPFCGPEQYKRDTVVESYRAYYIGDKARFAKWTRRSAPDWWAHV